MTEHQAVVVHGFTLWQNGYGWFANNGTISSGPHKSKIKLLAALDPEVERRAKWEQVLRVTHEGQDPPRLPADDGAVAQALQLNPVRAKGSDDEPRLCVGCHRLKPATTEFDGRARCPDCSKVRR